MCNLGRDPCLLRFTGYPANANRHTSRNLWLTAKRERSPRLTASSYERKPIRDSLAPMLTSFHSNLRWFSAVPALSCTSFYSSVHSGVTDRLSKLQFLLSTDDAPPLGADASVLHHVILVTFKQRQNAYTSALRQDANYGLYIIRSVHDCRLWVILDTAINLALVNW